MFEKSESVPALIPVIPCVDTLKVLRKEGDELKTVEGAVADRSVLYSAQTPQIFHSELLKSAYSLAYDTSFTDDASVLQKYGKSLSYVMGERLNIKITTQEDLLLARAVMSLREKV
jgi:2-C-methyl-D-erythritol 4-phosphate cytidylyltransferase